ncbi:MAG TPA: PAS domain-containing protein [Aliidongia sp.]|uniref:PAS domain-containing protein n=1 Tax=Aliidongia sp. TaxID=1914230 RepID=UPI002DDD4172|nr:PAS domain-containing protein [Aliidongia sp.]HEV2677882.1 PAS domain-containing protein [Aliidongia sp.]
MDGMVVGQVEAVELDIAGNPYPDLQRVHAYWTAKRQDRFAPRRRDIDPVDMVDVLPRIMLVDIEQEPLDFRYRLAGTGICDTHSTDPTGSRPRDLKPRAYGSLVDGHYRAVVMRRVPTLHLIVLDTHDRSSAYARLLLPLSEDGVRVTMLMAIDGKEQNGWPLRQFFETLTRRS